MPFEEVTEEKPKPKKIKKQKSKRRESPKPNSRPSTPPQERSTYLYRPKGLDINEKGDWREIESEIRKNRENCGAQCRVF